MLTPTIEPKLVIGGDGHDVIIQRCRDVARSTAELGLTNDFAIYCEILEVLKNTGHFNVVPLRNLGEQTGTLKTHIALRHDIDADIVTAIACARTLENYGLSGSFYPLHTSHYYIQPLVENEAEITRHEGLAFLLKALDETGVEIGLHNDSLGVSLDYGIDGAQLLTEEIAWLRDIGITVYGTVAHNSAAVYNCECFEVFSGLAVGNRDSVEKGPRTIGLGTLDPETLGLDYEGNYPIPKQVLDQELMRKITTLDGNPLHTPEWQHVYFIDHPVFERGYEYDIWLVGENLWLLAGEHEVTYPLNTTQMFEALTTLPKGSRVVISIHPIYVSKHSMSV